MKLHSSCTLLGICVKLPLQIYFTARGGIYQSIYREHLAIIMAENTRVPTQKYPRIGPGITINGGSCRTSILAENDSSRKKRKPSLGEDFGQRRAQNLL